MVAASKVSFSELVGVLKQLNSQGDFTITVLTDENGFPIASSDGDGDASELQSAVVAQIQKVIVTVQDHLSMAAPEELALNDVNGKRLVCRSFALSDNKVILAVQMPNKNKPYRQLMNRAIRSIQQTWNIE